MDPTARSSTMLEGDVVGSNLLEANNTTQLDFETAMNDFHVMFPGLELDVIEVSDTE